MNIRDAVITVLQEAGVTLHTKEITKRILSKGRKKLRKIPAAIASTKLVAGIQKKDGTFPFILYAPQTFSF
jgi:hypothetical protein